MPVASYKIDELMKQNYGSHGLQLIARKENGFETGNSNEQRESISKTNAVEAASVTI